MAIEGILAFEGLLAPKALSVLLVVVSVEVTIAIMRALEGLVAAVVLALVRAIFVVIISDIVNTVTAEQARARRGLENRCGGLLVAGVRADEERPLVDRQ